MPFKPPAGCGPERAAAFATPAAERGKTLLRLACISGGIVLWCWLRELFLPQSLVAVGLYFAYSVWANVFAKVRAGDGWFTCRAGVIRTDRLVRARSTAGLTGIFIILRDADGRHIKVNVRHMASDPAVWALVLAGVAVSVANGLVADDWRAAAYFGIGLRPGAKSRPGRRPAPARAVSRSRP